MCLGDRELPVRHRERGRVFGRLQGIAMVETQVQMGEW